MKKLSLILFSIIILINFSFTNSSEKNTVKGKARIIDGDTIEIKEKSKQIALVVEAVALAERDVPEYVSVDHSKMSAKFVRTPVLSDVPYPVMMEPNLVVEFYAKN